MTLLNEFGFFSCVVEYALYLEGNFGFNLL